MTNLDSMLKSRDITLPTKVCLVKAMVFPVVMYGCESWTVKKAECRKIDAFELWCWRRLLRVPWTARRSNQSILSLEHSLVIVGLLIGLSSLLCVSGNRETQGEGGASLVAQSKESACNAGDLGSIPGLGRSPGEGNGSPLQYSCLENSITEEPGRLQFMGLQRVGHD